MTASSIRPIPASAAAPALRPADTPFEPLRAWTAPQLSLIASRVEAAVREWRAAWALAQTPVVAEAEACGDAGVGEILLAWMDEGAGAAKARQAIGQSMFDRDLDAPAAAEGPRLARQLADEAFEDLLSRLGHLLDQPDLRLRDAPPAVAGGWPGHVRVRLDLDLPLVLWLHASVATRLVPPTPTASPSQKPPLVAIDAAIAHHRITVAAHLQPIELRLGELGALAVGDVVRLTHALDEPAELRDAAQRPLARGWLGQHDHHVALELA